MNEAGHEILVLLLICVIYMDSALTIYWDSIHLVVWIAPVPNLVIQAPITVIFCLSIYSPELVTKLIDLTIGFDIQASTGDQQIKIRVLVLDSMSNAKKNCM